MRYPLFSCKHSTLGAPKKEGRLRRAWRKPALLTLDESGD
jgi:hypothetical protein